MSDTQWISVNERLPETAYSTLVLMASQGQRTGFYALKWYLHAPDGVPVEPPSPVTHWMDLPEPPKPADPFEAWWEPNKGRLAYHTTIAMSAWNAAKAHYERPLPDFEAWWGTLRPIPSACELRDVLARQVDLRVAQHIWNAAQGKPEA